MATIETKLDIGDKIFFIFGNPKKNIIVVSAKITRISIYTDHHIMYGFADAKVEVDKENVMKADYAKFGFCFEKDLDPKNSLLLQQGLSAYPTFTSKQKCIDYLRKVTK